MTNGLASFTGAALSGPPAPALSLLFTHCVPGPDGAAAAALCGFAVASAAFSLAAAPAALASTRNLSRAVLRAGEWAGPAGPGPAAVRLVDAGGVWAQWYPGGAPAAVTASLCVSTDPAAGEYFCRGEAADRCRQAADLYPESRLEGAPARPGY